MQQTGNVNWQPPEPPEGNQGQRPKELPNAVGAFVMGIISLCLSPICCCYGNFIALVLSIIGLVLANGSLTVYQKDPWAYNEKHYKQAKSGRLLNTIALIVSSFITLIFIIMLATGNSPTNYDDLFKNMN
jgi:hypothetical protein